MGLALRDSRWGTRVQQGANVLRSRTREVFRCGIVALLTIGSASAAYGQTVPGFTVEPYASVTDPVRLAFAPDGTLFVGRDPSATGSITPVRIHRVGTDGVPTEYGDSAIPDPDALIYDAAGVVSGVSGSVIVGGIVTQPTGRISAIRPGGAVETLFESNEITNPSAFRFDSTGRLIFLEFDSRQVFVTSGGAPTPLYTISGSAAPAYLAVDAADRIFTSSTDGKIRIHGSDGSVIDDAFATLAGFCAIDFGLGGSFGTDLFALEQTSGLLFRIDSAGSVTQIGSGFATTTIFELAFGPDGNLYVAEHAFDRILKISPDLIDVASSSPQPNTTIRATPNPFTSSLTLEVNGRGLVAGLAIYDAAGRLVNRLYPAAGAVAVNGTRLVWDGHDRRGNDAGLGVFYVEALGPGGGAARKIVRVR